MHSIGQTIIFTGIYLLRVIGRMETVNICI